MTGEDDLRDRPQDERTPSLEGSEPLQRLRDWVKLHA